MNILFVCTHNACRSILAEAITNQLSNGRISAASAGSEPAGHVHPLTLKYLKVRGYSTEKLNSKSWGEAVDDLKPDIIITVCDQAAGETCPISIGDAIKGHWGLIDPSHLPDDSYSEEDSFNLVINTIEKRMQFLLSQPVEEMDKAALQAFVNRIGSSN